VKKQKQYQFFSLEKNVYKNHSQQEETECSDLSLCRELFLKKKIMKLKQRKKIFKKTFLRAKKMEKYKF